MSLLFECSGKEPEESEIHEAARAGDATRLASIVSSVLQSSCAKDLDNADEDGCTALHLAADSNAMV